MHSVIIINFVLVYGRETQFLTVFLKYLTKNMALLVQKLWRKKIGKIRFYPLDEKSGEKNFFCIQIFGKDFFADAMIYKSLKATS